MATHGLIGMNSIIHLKNGWELQTSYYWEEEHEIKFYVYGGVMGVSRQSIEKIQEWNNLHLINIHGSSYNSTLDKDLLK